MAETNIYQELKDALDEFKTFLDSNIGTVKTAVDALRPMLGDQIDQLITELSNVLGQIKTKIQELDTNIPGLTEVTDFTSSITTVLEASKNLVPDLADEVDSVLGAAQIVTSLPSLDQVKQDIIDLLTAIIAHVDSLSS